jgi:hypothetical protein
MQKLLSVKYITSKLDRNGNTYSAIRVTNLATRQTASALTDSGVRDVKKLFETYETLGVREFNRECKKLPYIGNDFPGWIRDNVGFEFNAKYAPGRRVLIQFAIVGSIGDLSTRSYASFYTTIQDIRDGVGQCTGFNEDTRNALARCEAENIVGTTYGDENQFQLSLC